MLQFDDPVGRALLVMTALGMLGLVVLAVLWLMKRGGSNRKTLGIGLLLVAFLFQMLLVEPPALNLGIQVYFNDVIVVLMTGVLLMAFVFKRLPIRGLPTVLWLALGLVMLISFAEGTQLYGKTAGVDVRPNFYFWVAGLYCCVVDFDERDFRQMARWCVWTAYGLIGIAAYRWIGYQVGIVELTEITEVGAGNEFRALPSGAAFYIGAVGLVEFMAWMRGSGKRTSGLHAFIFAVMVLVLQHRSVWLSTGVSYTFVLFQQSKYLPRRLPWLIGFATFGAVSVGLAMYFGLLDRLLETLWESTVSVGDPKSTATDRVFGWEALMSEWLDSSWGTIAFGYPYGTSYRRVVERIVVEYSPHNFYVQWLLRVGVVGTCLFALATLAGMLHSLYAWVDDESDYLLMRGTGLVLLASLVYYVPYQGFYLHGAVTGVALAQLVRYRQLRKAQAWDRARAVGRVPTEPVLAPGRRALQKVGRA
jgi:hypothetical protein